MVNLLPAVLIGGPSHGDKAKLFYSLTNALRERDISHHALRVQAVNEKTLLPHNEHAHVRYLPVHATRNDDLVEHLGYDLSQRLLPLLVDVGVDDQHLHTCILQHCTHSILLFHRHGQESEISWSQLGEHYGLLPLAHFSSSPKSSLLSSTEQDSTITGTFVSLEYASLAQDPLFDCLVERIASLFSAYSHKELLSMHLRQAPGELSLHLATLLPAIAPGVESWEPSLLCALFDYIPAHMSLSVYGHGPQWLYAALAAYTRADAFYQFSPFLGPGEMSSGWVASPPLLLSTATRPEIQITYTGGDKSGRLTVTTTDVPLDYLQATSLLSLPFPPVPPHLGLILAGTMPTWLLTAVVRLYVATGVVWIACHQSQQCRAVVIFSQTTQHFVGETIATF